jgi:hypothetical protein
MASITDRAVTAATKLADRPAIVAYKGKLIEHAFMSRPAKLADGTYSKREATGEVAYVYRICPVLADGTTTTSGAIWLWLEQPRKKGAAPKLDPQNVRAFQDSLQPLFNDLQEQDAEAVENGDWDARPSKAVAPEAKAEPPKKGLAARAARAAAEADGAKSVDLDTGLSDLPF